MKIDILPLSIYETTNILAEKQFFKKLNQCQNFLGVSVEKSYIGIKIEKVVSTRDQL